MVIMIDVINGYQIYRYAVKYGMAEREISGRTGFLYFCLDKIFPGVCILQINEQFGEKRREAQLLLIETQTVCFKTQRQKTNVVNLKHHNFDDVSFREFFARIRVGFYSLYKI